MIRWLKRVLRIRSWYHALNMRTGMVVAIDLNQVTGLTVRPDPEAEGTFLAVVTFGSHCVTLEQANLQAVVTLVRDLGFDREWAGLVERGKP